MMVSGHDDGTGTAVIVGGGSLAIPSSLSNQNLLLDSAIRDWVVLPLLVIMIAAGLLRHYVSQLLRATNHNVSYIDSRCKSCIMRAGRLRTGAGGYLSKSKWESRRRYLSTRESSSSNEGYLREEADWAESYDANEDGEENDAITSGSAGSAGGNNSAKEKKSADPLENMNPMAMMDGMKGNMVFMVQNMVMMQGISHFFRGYVLVKVPFPLTNGFKMMFQRGLDLSTLDTSYVSSVSWYFLVMYGLRAFFRLTIGDVSYEVRESSMIQNDLGMAPGSAPPRPFDAPKALRAEADNLEIARVRFVVDDAERKLLGKRYPKKKSFMSSMGSRNPGDDILGFGSVSSSSSSKSSSAVAGGGGGGGSGNKRKSKSKKK